MWALFAAHRQCWYSESAGWVTDVDKATRYTLAERSHIAPPFACVWKFVGAQIESKAGAGFRSVA